MGFPAGSDDKESACSAGDPEDPLEKGMATLPSILAWRIPWTEEPGGLYSPWGHKESDMTEQLSTSHAYCFFLLLKQKTCFPLVIQ